MKTLLLILLTAISATLAAGQVRAQSSSSSQPPPVSPPATAVGGLLHLPASSQPGVGRCQQLLEQMAAALGGEAYLNLQDMEQSGRTYKFYHGEAEGAGTEFWRFWKWPDQDRLELTKQRDWAVLFVGDRGYEITYRGAAALDKDQLDDYLRRRNHSLPWVLRRWLKEPGIALFYGGVAIAERKQAEQVSVLNAENDAVTVWIDSNTHLPLRVGFSWRDPKTHDRTDEAEEYDNYRPVQGIMTPFSITRYSNGEPANQRFITSTKYNQNPPSSLFETKLTVDQRKPKKGW